VEVERTIFERRQALELPLGNLSAEIVAFGMMAMVSNAAAEEF